MVRPDARSRPSRCRCWSLAFVASVSDAENLRQGVKEYFDVVRDAIELVREIDPEDVPEFELPKPEKRELDGGGKLYVYPLPDEWGVDDRSPSTRG